MKSTKSNASLEPLPSLAHNQGRILTVDLNNFASFPTLAIGILTASLRNSGFEVNLISPLAYDVPAAERERAENMLDHWQRRIHLSTFSPLIFARDALRQARNWYQSRPHPIVISEVKKALETGPQVILLSAYLQHFQTVRSIGELAKAAGIPMIVGGPAFSQTPTIQAWQSLPGLTALVGGEMDIALPSLLKALLNGDDIGHFPGVVLPDGRSNAPAPPFRDLDASPVPDFSDFPWDRYPVKIIPLMASRGCQWNKCNFCSDIVSVSGRSFRTRSPESVLHEMREQASRHATKNFLFLDLKLNSNPSLFRAIVENVQRTVRGAEWIGTVHVDLRPDNGLSRAELKAAARSGMRRVSFGLESGSQRMLDAMNKGSSVEANSEFIRNAHDAGISVRCTMFKGYPGETAQDLELTASFLEKHVNHIDRIRFNEFSVLAGTPIYDSLTAGPNPYSGIHATKLDSRNGKLWYSNADGADRAYRRAKARVLDLVYQINRRQIGSSARVFDGLM